MKGFTWKLRSLSLLAVVMVTGSVGVSYGQARPAALVGRWVSVDGGCLNGVDELELFNDGKGVTDSDEFVAWEASSGRFVLDCGLNHHCFGKKLFFYTVKGHELIFSNADGVCETFVRKEHLAAYEKKKEDEARRESGSAAMNNSGKASSNVGGGGSGGGDNGGALKGGRSRASIQGVVMQNMAALRYAYNKRLREKPGMAGKITVTFAVDEFGKVIFTKIVESTIGDSELEATVVSRVKSWDFGQIDKPGDVTEITYPFTFSQ